MNSRSSSFNSRMIFLKFTIKRWRYSGKFGYNLSVDDAWSQEWAYFCHIKRIFKLLYRIGGMQSHL